MEWAIAPAAVLFYGLSFAFAYLKWTEKETPQQRMARLARRRTSYPVYTEDMTAQRQIVNWDEVILKRKRRKPIEFDWRKEGF